MYMSTLLQSLTCFVDGPPRPVPVTSGSSELFIIIGGVVGGLVIVILLVVIAAVLGRRCAKVGRTNIIQGLY
jgi:hypothetical protein